MKKRKALFLLVPAVLAIVAITVGQAPASGTQKWYLGGTALSGTSSETLGGLATPSTLVAAGVTTTCQNAFYIAKATNSSGIGGGSITSLPLYECSANASCTLTKVEPTHLPWTMTTTTVASKPYVFIEGVTLSVSYTGASCPLAGSSEVKGSIGGLYENSTQKTVFNSASATATGASLKDGTTNVSYTGSYTVEAVGTEHTRQTVELK
jgi:hypothetical protein